MSLFESEDYEMICRDSSNVDADDEMIRVIIDEALKEASPPPFVLGMQTTNGNLTPPNSVKLTWGIIQSSAAAVLLASGGLNALQTAAIIAALPFTIIMILMIVSLFKELTREHVILYQDKINKLKLKEEKLKLKEEKLRLKEENAALKKQLKMQNQNKDKDMN